jgi:ATP-dependent DNA helicase 2 subunit 1
MLPFGHGVKKSTFIYPSEEDYVGSTRVFSALWQKLIKDKKMGVAWYIARTNASPILVAILPSEERADDTTKVPVIPAGLWLYQLPFADDKRDLGPIQKPLVAPDDLTDEMRKVINNLQNLLDGPSDEEI